VVIAGILRRVGIAFCGRIAQRLHERDRVKRAETLERVVRYGAPVTITLIVAVLILSEVGVAIAPIVGAAEIADRTGTVEDVTLCYVRLRDTAGSVHHVPNSEINVVANINRGGPPTPHVEAPIAEAPPAAAPTAKKRATQPA
jgi:small-conductance mechanosensitive channel